jgi:hypothetical protein
MSGVSGLARCQPTADLNVRFSAKNLTNQLLPGWDPKPAAGSNVRFSTQNLTTRLLPGVGPQTHCWLECQIFNTKSDKLRGTIFDSPT